MELGILDKEIPMLAKNEKNGIYCIQDAMYRFWHRFIPGMVTLIENNYAGIYEKRVKPYIADYMGHMFEQVCRQYMLRLNVNDRLPFLFDSIGRWWGGNPITKKEAEIDLIAASGNQLIICECKWQNEMTGINVFRDLCEKAALFSRRDIYYYLFSKSGFTAPLIEESAKNDRLTLVGIDDLFNLKTGHT
jgi:AAA+ ATPase superfamily predicted ATPase